MARVNEAWLAYQRKRWTRPDAHRWFAPNYKNFAPPQRKAGFDPDQPRDQLGQWTETGAEDDGDGTESFAEATPLDELSSADRPRGHHFVARSIYRDIPISPEAKAVFDKAVTGPLRSGPHGWSKEHDVYNRAVRELFENFMTTNKITPETMTASQATTFVESVKRSVDPRIRGFNLNIYRRELHYLLRFGPRRPE